MNKFNTIILLILAILSTGLLIGNRLGFTWAGGEGFEKHETAFVIIDEMVPYNEIERGQTLSSGDLDTLMFIIGESEVYLDKNTEVKLVDGRKDKEMINVIQGRVVVLGKITIQTREVKTKMNGTASFVHYSWLDDIEIAPLDGSVTVDLEDESHLIESAVKLHTLEPYNIEQIDFDPESSSASEFYEKVL